MLSVVTDLLHTLNPDRWSQAFLASKMSSYTTNAVPRVSGVLPTLICRMAPYLPNMSYLGIRIFGVFEE